MKDVFILATHPSLVQKAEKIIAEEGLDRIDIFFCKTVEEMLRFVTEALPATVEVLLSGKRRSRTLSGRDSPHQGHTGNGRPAVHELSLRG